MATAPKKFEAGIQHYAGIIGLGVACDFLDGLGKENILQHERKLTAHALTRLGELEDEGKLEIYGPKDANKRVGVLAFNVKTEDGTIVNAHDVAILLNEIKKLAIRSGFHCAQPFVSGHCSGEGTARASFYLYNTLEEIDVLYEGVNEAASIF